MAEFVRPDDGAVIDSGICLWFSAPNSFTGEEVVEFHCHGSSAVIAAISSAIGGLDGCRLAEAGEFTRRAFENGRMDLTEAEGLADLIAAETEMQRRQALALSQGGLSQVLQDWRAQLLRARALIEAELDFPEEDDIPGAISDQVWPQIERLASEMQATLARRGAEIVRDGYQIVIVGPPNAGKSSLLNALAGRDAAIVSEEAGTTRDVIEVQLDIAGYKVVLSDTAGIRAAESVVEAEGIRRALQRAEMAQLILSLAPEGESSPLPDAIGEVIRLVSKDDEGRHGVSGISVNRPDSIDHLLEEIEKHIVSSISSAVGSGIIARQRHRDLIAAAVAELENAVVAVLEPLELRAEYLRRAADIIGRLTGRIGVEEMLGAIFSEFCVGK